MKIANSADNSQQVEITFKGLKSIGQAKGTILTGNLDMENLVGRPETIKPTTVNLQGNKDVLSVSVPSKAFMVIRF